MELNSRNAIVTTVQGSKNGSGASIVAKAVGGQCIIKRDYALGLLENHLAAAAALARKLRMFGAWTEAQRPSDVAHVYTPMGEGGADIGSVRPAFIVEDDLPVLPAGNSRGEA